MSIFNLILQSRKFTQISNTKLSVLECFARFDTLRFALPVQFQEGFFFEFTILILFLVIAGTFLLIT